MIKEKVMQEYNLQEDFIEQITGKKDVKKDSIGVYKYLVYNNFFDVIRNAFPFFYKVVEQNNLEQEFEQSIYEFIQTSAFSPFIWKLSNEYRKFIKSSQFFNTLEYRDELLLFEYSELYIFMQKKSKKSLEKFSLKNNYKLSSKVILQKYSYDFLNMNLEEKHKTYILGYFDFKLQEVVYREINIYMYKLLKSLLKTKTLKENLKLFMKKNGLSYKKYKEEFAVALAEIYRKKVIV
jgi:hypothetical protein